MISCEIFCNLRATHHLQQVYTGFVQLHKNRVIRLKQRMCRSPGVTTGLKVLLNGTIPIYYDLHDSERIDTQSLEEVDFYFKRSFIAEHARHSEKIHPLGLNYCVYHGRTDFFKLARDASYGSMPSRLKRVLKQVVWGCFPTPRELEAFPNLDQPARVLLMTQLWSPDKLTGPVEPPAEEVNWMRVECIRLLRKEFGSRFFGGVMPDDFSRQHFADVVLPDRRLCERRTYLAILRQFPICVTTMGLHRSNGARLGEYVALSKAIVTEQLAFKVPGEFANDVNYLEFSTPEECVEATARLVNDRQLRHRVMTENFRYYHAFLKPDSLILSTLAVALRGEREPREAVCEATIARRDV